MKKTIIAVMSFLACAIGHAQNPYLPLWEHLPDGEPRVFEDPDHPGQYRAYIIGSHDMTYTAYCGNDVRMWSAPVSDLSQWRDEGPIFSHYVNGQWDTMYAPDLVETTDRRTGKRTYWLYPHSRGWGRVAMVCKGDRPNGPFTPVNLTADGTRCVDGSLIDFDPSVFVERIDNPRDADYARGYRAYVFYGFRHSTAFELNPDNMYGVRPGTQVHDYFLPASERYGVVRDPEGTQYPALCRGQNPGDFNFFEASSIRQVGNKYVMVFSGYSGPDYGLSSTNSALRYAYGDSPLGPWRSGGVLVDSRGVVPNENGSHLTTTNFGHNTHGSLQQINGQWYVFYHRAPRGFGNARQPMVAPVKIECDKRSVAQGGKVRIVAYDPYAKNHEWTAAAADGNVYTGAEVTSEGFQIFGLNPYQKYSAGIACYVNGNNWMQDNFDNWDNNMDLAGITNGGVVGFKYFGFGGLARDTKGVKAFAGTAKGDHTMLNLQLTPGGHGSVRIHVMLDGPYANDTWKGREIAVIDIPADARQERATYSVPVPAVEGLKGKHALYLVTEGADLKPTPLDRNPYNRSPKPQRPQGLFDLHSLEFTKAGMACTIDEKPIVKITVDGHEVALPTQPQFATNANGIMDLGHYQAYAPLHEGSTIRATASNPAVKIAVGKVVDGRAVVTCTYKGAKRVYKIN